MGYSYRQAGVDIDAGNQAVELMKPAVKRTVRPEVMGGLGGFGGLFALDLKKYPEPVLVSGTDGVGTKLKLAFQMNRHDTIGQDAVAMCVNDILVQGAEPLFFLDYLAVGKLVPERVAQVVGGIAKGCELAGCALIGGETAEMPGFYDEGEYDIAGFAVGAVNRPDLIDGSQIQAGDVLIGLPSSGFHSNGYSLVRKIFTPDLWEKNYPELGETLGEALIRPTRIYVKTVLPLIESRKVLGMAHITGGGLTENIPRILPEGLGIKIARSAWQVPALFTLLQRLGEVEEAEMLRTFNMGIGFVLIVHPEDVDFIQTQLQAAGEKCFVLGEVSGQSEGVSYL
ncbi:phosphoribosylformylglycinamidine cyclo-ligase [Desulfitobacterium sp. LBE]|uniref:Phosphoribosylformylglycinamidine cyclo-ligase n=4 Tax=root TaxID=1 RepID=PUR5_DESHY|nr:MULTISPECIES: phosphoribosylformylglycinamidine cyclo-ligase [Desulfitobacterium]B8FP03.1 RecName: Full=Phosphoribosylformylglycinamidine cyclo-ligase; AltName: Full=AIR synthase; AltName: Full=AIRS; AltName: Full=Phosphoribosyl-aminoimidazole synthetase [Desulfitobacterium hafniense DCB-2]Q24QH4.1 RecName: Full=Phosphoribosylformylglycinamidine cyclo-ligase; AltName: Full=AIR synthase; AltName: Full=AIRS; AltName: Full=Phosphoribosyl-aminoimidazole synthetase [Desulfitobacterium hafniense Y51